MPVTVTVWFLFSVTMRTTIGQLPSAFQTVSWLMHTTDGNLLAVGSQIVETWLEHCARHRIKHMFVSLDGIFSLVGITALSVGNTFHGSISSKLSVHGHGHGEFILSTSDEGLEARQVARPARRPQRNSQWQWPWPWPLAAGPYDNSSFSFFNVY